MRPAVCARRNSPRRSPSSTSTARSFRGAAPRSSPACSSAMAWYHAQRWLATPSAQRASRATGCPTPSSPRSTMLASPPFAASPTDNSSSSPPRSRRGSRRRPTRVPDGSSNSICTPGTSACCSPPARRSSSRRSARRSASTAASGPGLRSATVSSRVRSTVRCVMGQASWRGSAPRSGRWTSVGPPPTETRGRHRRACCHGAPGGGPTRSPPPRARPGVRLADPPLRLNHRLAPRRDTRSDQRADTAAARRRIPISIFRSMTKLPGSMTSKLKRRRNGDAPGVAIRFRLTSLVLRSSA